jgi:formamidopyrimidine-DNA glycosylase
MMPVSLVRKLSESSLHFKIYNMPELPEVETTVRGLNKTIKGLVIKDAWTNYNSPFHKTKDNIKNPSFFNAFRKHIVGAKVVKTERKAKNILIHLNTNKTILVHMKMTGHLLFGLYNYGRRWTADPSKIHSINTLGLSLFLKMEGT